MRSRLYLQTLTAVLGACMAASGRAAPREAPQYPPAPNAAAPQANAAAAIPAPDLQAFVDGMMDIQLKRDDAAGAVVLLAQDGRTLLSKGYGLANVRARESVDPASTVFRAGTVSMLFTTVAAMQLVEQGRLSLDEDVNQYLDFKIPPREGGAITLRTLLTHTAGFGASVDGRGRRGLRAYLVGSMPARAYAAGTIPAFSDYGAALAGYIVQRVSGESFEDYVARRIFLPLGMLRSTFAQPLPAALAADASQGYGRSTRPASGFETLAPSPAMALSTTAEDMGRFGEALLGGGELDGHRILRPASVGAMLSRQFAVDDGLPAMGLGFHQIWFNGLHSYGQGGDTATFHCEFEIDPQQRIVLFVAYNSSGRGGQLASFSRGELVHGILDRYIPFHPAVHPLAASAEDAREMRGTWTPSRATPSNGFFALPLFHQLRSRIDPADGTLAIDGFVSDRGPVKRWQKIAPHLWQQFPQDRIFAIADSQGHVQRLALAADPSIQLLRVPWFENSRLNAAAMAASLLALLLAAARHAVRKPMRWVLIEEAPAGAALLYLAWFAIHWHLLRPLFTG